MPFNSLSYFLFLPVVFLIHYFSPDRFRWLVLLAASFFFYSALKAPHLIAVLLLVTTITFFTGIWIDRLLDQRIKRYFLWGGISANVLTLVSLKYLPFLTQNLNLLLNLIAPGAVIPVSKSIIAIGVSYFIFQAISYLIDIYLEVEKPERHYGHFILYMSFFPKLLQGPIERGSDLLPQFKVPYVFNYDNVRSGMLLFAIGLLKKVVIADRLALMVNPVFDNVHAYKGFPLLLATYYYSLQIYFDFSGYTDMALGTALMFNISLTQNFNNPYFATSIVDFWRRWHISFSRWILDYIFKPLQMSWRNWGNWGAAFSLIITFTMSGIWHGASWGFVVWGVLHGVYLVSSTYYRPYQKRLHRWLGVEKSPLLKWWQVFVTFNLVSLAWVFFRAPELRTASYVISNYFYVSNSLQPELSFSQFMNYFIPIITSISVVFWIRNEKLMPIFNKRMIFRWFFYYFLLFVTWYFYVPDVTFIYFRF